MPETPTIPTVRWCVHFETTDGKSHWFDQVAKHPAGAKRAAIDELERMGYEVATFHSVTRTDAKQSRAAMRMFWDEADGVVDMLFNLTIGRLFDRERGDAYA